MDVSGPGSYPIGDVNVSGKRDAADALLVLKYDVGLTPGVTTWPPGPATVYLPLCDVTEDGTCNSSDALRILLCEVDLASCGPQSVTAADAAAEVPADAPPVYLSTEQEVDAGTGQVVVRVRAESPDTPLAVASLDLRYDPAQADGGGVRGEPRRPARPGGLQPGRTSPIRCATPASQPAASSKPAPLLELRLRPVDADSPATDREGSPAIEIAEATLFDLEGNALRPVLGSKEPAETPRRIFLPIILAGAGSPGTEVAPEPPAAEPTPEPTVPSQPRPWPSRRLSRRPPSQHPSHKWSRRRRRHLRSRQRLSRRRPSRRLRSRRRSRRSECATRKEEPDGRISCAREGRAVGEVGAAGCPRPGRGVVGRRAPRAASRAPRPPVPSRRVARRTR